MGFKQYKNKKKKLFNFFDFFRKLIIMRDIVPNSKRAKDQSTKRQEDNNKSAIVNVANAFSTDISKLKSISFKVHLKCTNEYFNVKKFPVSMKVRDLKSLLEFVCGIPFDLQRLSYLDDGDLKNLCSEAKQ